MASRPRITAARVLAGIACAMLLPAASQAAAPAHRALHLSSHGAIRTVRHGAVPGEVIVRFRPHVAAHRRAHLAHAAGVRLSHWLGTRGVWLVRVAARAHGDPRDLGARALGRRPLGRAKPLRVAQRHDARRSALRPGLGPPQHRARSSRASPERPTPTSTRPRRGIRRPARATWSSRSSIPASTTRTRIWPRTSGRTPARRAAARSRMGSTTTGTATSTTGTAGTSASTPTIRWTRSGTGRMSRARSAPPADNGTGVTGVNWNVQIMPLRVADAGGNLSDAAVAAAFAYAGQMGAKVVNASLGGAYTSTRRAGRDQRRPEHALRGLGRQLEPEHQEHRDLAVHASRREHPVRRGDRADRHARLVLELRADPGRHRRAGREHPEHAPRRPVRLLQRHVDGLAARRRRRGARLRRVSEPLGRSRDRGDPERRRPQVRPHDLVRERPPPERRRCARRRGDPAARPDARQPERAHVGRRGAERDREPARPRPRPGSSTGA